MVPGSSEFSVLPLSQDFQHAEDEAWTGGDAGGYPFQEGRKGCHPEAEWLW